ncbi:bifunctional nicotinamide-nucleotide adenylyltransferase/Nudix hydroxylase [soil metagenome]
MHDLAVFIGRFQPFHNGHLALLQHALSAAQRCIVVIGSAFHARSPRHPFSWQQRADMIRRALPAADRERVTFVPVRDHHEDTPWIVEVRQAVEFSKAAKTAKAPTRLVDRAASDSTLFIGHRKDATTAYLDWFPEWQLKALPIASPATARGARDTLFGGTDDAALRAMVPPPVFDFLQTWRDEPPFAALKEEWTMLQDYRATWAAAPWPPTLVTVDCVVKCSNHVLLIRRGEAPGKGLLAVPGGFIEQRETTHRSALRELEEETHLDVPDADLRACLKGTAVFDAPDRSERGRTITHAHYFDLGDRALPTMRADDDAASASWTPISALVAEETHFMDDHFAMLHHFLQFDLPAPLA